MSVFLICHLIVDFILSGKWQKYWPVCEVAALFLNFWPVISIKYIYHVGMYGGGQIIGSIWSDVIKIRKLRKISSDMVCLSVQIF